MRSAGISESKASPKVALKLKRWQLKWKEEAPQIDPSLTYLAFQGLPRNLESLENARFCLAKGKVKH